MTEHAQYERWHFPAEPEPVESSLFRSMRYDDKAQLLELVFRNGRTYQYVNVPPEIYAALHESASKGRYFLAHIRDVFPYWRLHRAVRRAAPD